MYRSSQTDNKTSFSAMLTMVDLKKKKKCTNKKLRLPPNSLSASSCCSHTDSRPVGSTFTWFFRWR